MIEDNLLKNRIVFLIGEVNYESAYNVITRLLYLDSINHEDINLYIDSPGGSVIQGMAIIDCMNIIKSKVSTYCIGSAYSMGAVILSCGEKGKRYCLENSEVMIHSPSSSMEGKADEISLSSKRLSETKQRLLNILSKNTNKTKQQLNKYFNYDKFMNSEESKKFGIIDSIIKST